MASKSRKKSKAGADQAQAESSQQNLDTAESLKEQALRTGAYHVTLPAFEGPLDLLLHLIQQHELDIFDIPISFISTKYVEYITLMQELNIDLASEYLVMAASLAHIKSKMLLPKPPVDQDDDAVDELDPRGELVRRLLEYQKYKDAAEQLGDKPVLGRDVFVRGAPAPTVDGQAPLAQVSVFKLFDAFQRLLSQAKQTAEHLIDVDKISISERIIQLTDILRGKGKVPFLDLFDEETTRSDLIVTFLALLEMTRLRMMLVIQEAPLEPIFIELTLADEHDEILRRDLSDGDPLAELTRAAMPDAPVADEPVENAPTADESAERASSETESADSAPPEGESVDGAPAADEFVDSGAATDEPAESVPATDTAVSQVEDSEMEASLAPSEEDQAEASSQVEEATTTPLQDSEETEGADEASPGELGEEDLVSQAGEFPEK